jgi:hypothetical protein
VPAPSALTLSTAAGDLSSRIRTRSPKSSLEIRYILARNCRLSSRVGGLRMQTTRSQSITTQQPTVVQPRCDSQVDDS